MNMSLAERMKEFVEEYRIKGKGALSVVLVLTRKAKTESFPLDAQRHVTEGGGQVAGLGGMAVQSILKDHGIDRVLAREGGRTSRGSLDTMRNYIRFLNELHEAECLDLVAIEEWWIERVKDFFAAKPFRLRMDLSKSLRSLVMDIINQAMFRQQEMPGAMIAGAMMQHLVGAKLEVSINGLGIKHHGYSVADEPSGRKGDFLIGNTAIHVTTAPTEALMEKCQQNIEHGLHPLIITTETGCGGAKALSSAQGLDERIEILEISQFVTTNICELSQFNSEQRPVVIRRIFEKYNEIIDTCETDPSLKIIAGAP